ncbi:MAG: RluA family pseudouridine synthase [Anaerolineae bacterium]|nr:MAG: RluA family pseudouridine synthase [Anaerolineae bacterium]
MKAEAADFVVEPPGGRLDAYLAERIADRSRTSVQSMIRNGQVQVNGKSVAKPAFELHSGDTIRVSRPNAEPHFDDYQAQALEIVHETTDYMVVNKPAGIVVHPSPGHESGTLAQAAIAHAPELRSLGEAGRGGLVHRLDKDTSGLILFAKNEATLTLLQQQFKTRKIKKTYLALVDGSPPSDKGRVEAPIARDPRNRKRFAVLESGRPAVTEFRIKERFDRHALLEAFPISGRTHQIRIHMKFLGCPVVGDEVYGRKKRSLDVERQQLHAWKLRLPNREEFEAPFPADLADAIRQASRI